ncbi:hypothetical protein HDG32_001049 [Paraburkholderia sp. CI2]|nr:hypothetical protein [Paraburkholderia sp. CI2]
MAHDLIPSNATIRAITRGYAPQRLSETGPQAETHHDLARYSSGVTWHRKGRA